MSNVVEFVLRMKDMMSNSVASAARNAISHLNAVERAADRIPSSFNRNSGSFASSGASMGKIFGGNFLATAATSIISGLSSKLMDAGGAIIGGVFQKQKDLGGLETFLGANGAHAAYNQIERDAINTPFGTNALLEVNKALISTGLNAKQAREDTLALATAISASGKGNEELQRMAYNLQQIKSLGVASAVDIKQFGIAGINIYKILEDATGRTAEEVKEMNITYETLSYALRKAAGEGGIFYGAMDRYAKSLPGMWDSFREGMQKTARDIGVMLEPAIGGVLKFLHTGASALENIIGKAQPVFSWINEAVLGILNGTSEWYGWVARVVDVCGYVLEVYSWIFGGLSSILGSAIEWVKQSELLKDVYSAIGEVVKWIAWLVGNLIEGLKIIWNNVVLPILDGIEMAYRWIKELMGGTVTVAATANGNIPSATTNNNPLGFGTPTDIGGGAMSTKGVSSKGVTASGPKTITVNINKEMIGALSINSMNVREGVAEMEGMVKEMLYRLLIGLETEN